MSEFTRVRLRDISSRVATRNSIGNTNVLTISATHGLVNQEEFFNRRVAGADLSQYHLLKEGDFAYNKSYSAGRPAGVVRRLEGHEAGVVSPLYICFRPDDRRVNSSYLQYYFDSGLLDDSILWIAKEGVRNHGLLNVGVGDFFDLSVELPSLADQEWVVEVLDSVTELERGIEASIAKLRSLRQGVLLSSMESVVSQNPLQGWIRVPLRDVVPSVEYGISEALDTDTRGVPVLRMNNIQSGRIDVEELRFCSTASISGKLLLRRGDVLFNRTNSMEHVGKAAVWRNELPNASFASYLVRLIPDLRRVTPEFLVEWLMHPLVRKRVRSISTVAVQQVNVNPSRLRELEIDIPVDLAEQRSIVATLEASDEQISREIGELKKIRDLKQGLGGDLLTGRVAVSTMA
ncbi:restriction endonuclease subunit S [Streptomyces sp. b94]|uniref:restriction endonuclease subunit S n=1 Tax=Streptomyces sp. b94 TaxID=1827634 RepID=UPI001B35A860|nr:restriction endonuclease subunit S [Streptomyces sp. b94]MBQ1099931.1 restriction endonuclease subunit S [Streptomyces sp. b94]